MTSSAGVVQETHKYKPFGEEIGGTFGVQPLKFAAMERDAASAKDYDHARFMSPLEGRFLSPDTLQGKILQPLGWNRYAYAFDNPLKYIDPNGLEAFVFIVAPSGGDDLKGSFGHAAIYVTSARGNAGVSFGGDFAFRRGPQAFVQDYTRTSGRDVTQYRLRTTAQQDIRMVEFMRRNPPTGLRVRTNNCATAVCNVLHAGNVVGYDTNPARTALGLADSPSALQESLESGSLSEDVTAVTHYPPAPAPPPTPELIPMNYLDFISRRGVIIDGAEFYAR